MLLDAFSTPDPPDTPPAKPRSAGQRRHDAFAALLHTLLAQPELPSVQGARPQVLIFLDLAAVFGLPPDHPLSGLTLADLSARLGIDLTEFGLDVPAAVEDQPGAAHEPSDGRPAAASPGERLDRQPGGEAPAAADHGRAGKRRTGDHTGAGYRDGESECGRAARPRPRFGSGVEVDPATVRGLLPAATIMAVLTLGPWRVVNVGAKHRTLPAWLRGVLAMIHRQCRGPDCDRPPNWAQAHHVTDWHKSHTTDLNDTLPLCAAHHDLITTKGWNATLDHGTGEVTWTSPEGRLITVPAPWP